MVKIPNKTDNKNSSLYDTRYNMHAQQAQSSPTNVYK